jgi:serine/threonine protein kinase
VFLEESTAYLADFGFDSLRKYASLFHNYSNKSAYTAPELLKEKGSMINTKTIKADIYSIGVMIW